MASEHERRLTEYGVQVDQLQETIKGLEEEVVVLRRRLQDAPKRVRTLEERLLETKGQLAQAVSQNEKLSATLREAREHIAALREEVEKLTMPPSAYGTYLGTNDDGTVDIFTAGRKMRVALHPEIEDDELRRGQEVVLNESLNVVLARCADVAGEVVTFKELLEDGTRALVVGRADEERVCELADELQDVKTARRRPLADGRPLGPAAREAAAARGRRARARGGPRRLVRRRRRPRRPDRDDQGRGRAAVPLRRPVPRARAAAAEGHPALRPARLRQDADREGGRELAREARRREAPAIRRPARTSSTSRAPSSSTSTSVRPSARSA